MGLFNKLPVLERRGGKCGAPVKSCVKRVLFEHSAFRISSAALANSDIGYTFSDEAPTTGVIEAEARSPPFGKSPGAGGCEDVASFGTGLSSDEVNELVVAGAGVKDLD